MRRMAVSMVFLVAAAAVGGAAPPAPAKVLERLQTERAKTVARGAHATRSADAPDVRVVRRDPLGRYIEAMARRPQDDLDAGTPIASNRAPRAAAATDLRVTVRDIGPEFGVSYAGEGFVINRNDPRQILLPSEAGIFKSVNGGHSWSPVNLDPAAFREGAYFVRQDPNNPLVLFAVTLVTHSAYRSEDFGDTWARVEGDWLFDSFADCAIRPGSSNIVFLLVSPTADVPLWKSVDGGQTFEPRFGTGLPEVILDPETEEQLADPQFTNMATTPANPDVIYVVHHVDSLGYFQPAIYKSVDGGEIFTRLEGGPPRPLQVFPHPTQPNIVFVQDSDTHSPGIYRSEDGGATFLPVAGGLPSDKFNFFVAFDRHHPSLVYVAGEGGFFRSVDGGITFQSLGLRPDQLGLGATTATVDPDNPNTLYVNTSRGNFKSVNGGVSFAAINKGWKAAFANHITFDNASKPSLYAAVPWGVGILKTRTRGNHYEQIPHPIDPGELTDGRPWPAALDVARTDPQFIVALTRRRGILGTVDGGESWTAATSDTAENRFSKVAIDPLSPINVYAASAFGASPGFYRSTDGGLTFERTYFDPTSDELSAFAALAIDPANPAVIYTGAFSRFDSLPDNALLKSTDGGLSFAATPLGVAASISDIAVDPVNSSNVYVAGRFRLSSSSFATKRLLRSTDAGHTFVAADTGLTGLIGPMAIDPHNPSRLFMWTTGGLFMSSDRAITWSLLEGEKTRQAALYRTSIAINPKKPNLLYLAGATILEVELKEGSGGGNELALVSVTATDATAAEAPADTGTFTVTRLGPTTGALTVFYTVGGTATNGDDYQTVSGGVALPAGAASATVTVTPLEDSAAEGPETVVLTLSADPAYSIGTPGAATVTILDDERPVVTVTSTDDASEIGPDPGTFTVTRTGPTTAPLTVTYVLLGSAVNGTDYEPVGTELTIPAGASSATVTITPIPDGEVEGTESVVLALSPDPAYVRGTPAGALLSITDSVVVTLTEQ